MRQITDRSELMDTMAEHLAIPTDEIEEAFDALALRQTFGRFEEIDSDELGRIERAVWDRATNGAEWPW